MLIQTRQNCKLCSVISNTNCITNKLTNKLCFTSGGKCNTTDTIYPKECTKHDHVGHNSEKLSGRFNDHHSDVEVKPKAYKLTPYFRVCTAQEKP